MKAKNMVKSTVSVLFASLCTKDLEPRYAAPQSGSSCTVVSPFLHHIPLAERKPKTPKIWDFSAVSILVYISRSTKNPISVCQLYPKLRIMHKKLRFHNTPVQLVQNEQRFDSCVIFQDMLSSTHIARKRKTWWKTRIRFYLPFSAKRSKIGWSVI